MTAQPGAPRDAIAIVVPVLNDWACFEVLVSEINALAPTLGEVSVFAVDDGSTEAPDIEQLRASSTQLRSLEIIELHCNLGHQRAIAIGLVVVEERGEFGLAIVVDADGEDRPADFARMMEAHRRNPSSVIVAQRAARAENLRFRAFYGMYTRTFHLLTGRRLDFGNFTLLGAPAVRRLVRTSELWNNYPAALMRSRVNLVRVPIDRHRRYAGDSRMSFVSLVNHGLGAMSVFVDAIFVRLLVLVGILSLGFITLSAVALGIRLGTELAVPGWATTVLGLSLLGVFQIFALLVITVFMLLANRATVPLVPSVVARNFVRDVRCVGRS